MPTLTLHALAPSHPCMTAAAALELKGLEFERVDFQPGPHVEEMASIYGEGNTTVPGLTIDDEKVHTSRAILARLEELEPEPSLYPSDAVREAEEWGDVEFQDLGRRIPWGSLHFRPECLGNFGGGGALDGPGTDFAIKLIRGTWKYHGLSAEVLAADLAGLPEKIDQVDALVADGVIGGERATAADLQIGATVRVLMVVGDVRRLIEGRPAAEVARRWFPDYAGDVPEGALPANWISW